MPLVLWMVLFSIGSELLVGLNTVCCEGRVVVCGQGHRLWVERVAPVTNIPMPSPLPAIGVGSEPHKGCTAAISCGKKWC